MQTPQQPQEVNLQLNDELNAFFQREQRIIHQLTGKEISLQDLIQVFLLDQVRVMSGTSEMGYTAIKQISPPATLPEYLTLVPAGESQQAVSEKTSQPGIRWGKYGQDFVPDFKELARMGPDRSFYPLSVMDYDAERLEKLYADPRFQRLACFVEGRIVLMAFLERIPYVDFGIPLGYDEYFIFIGDLTSAKDEVRKAATDTILKRYGPLYGKEWIRENQRPLGMAFLQLNPDDLDTIWWGYAAPLVEINGKQNILNESVSASQAIELLKAKTNNSSFQRLSQTIEGRLSLIAQVKGYSPETLSMQLKVDPGELSAFATDAKKARPVMTELFGNDFGPCWVAYGVNVPDNLLLYPLLIQSRELEHGAKAFLKRAFGDMVLRRLEQAAMEGKLLAEGERSCERCGRKINGRPQKRFCSSACQRAVNRRKMKEAELDGIDEVKQQTQETITSEKDSPEKKSRTKKESENALMDGLASWVPELGKGVGVFAQNFLGRAGDFAAEKVFGAKPQPGANHSASAKIFSSTFEQTDTEQHRKGELPEGYYPLSPVVHQFMGAIHFPFRMFVWGPPGHGKSTFCLKLAHALNDMMRCVYISAEEDPEGDTMREKVKLNCFGTPANGNLVMVNRLPQTDAEWQKLLEDKNEQKEVVPKYELLVYDSTSKMGIGPDYLETVSEKPVIGSYSNLICHVFVCHAEKDYSSYVGTSAWEHLSDIVVKVFDATATITKNRFQKPGEGMPGSTLDIFKTEFRKKLDAEAIAEKQKVQEQWKSSQQPDLNNNTPPAA